VLLALIAAGVVAACAVVTVIGSRRIAAKHPAAGRLVAVDGGYLHVVELGSRDAETSLPIVLVHGASGNLNDLLLALGARLAQNRRVILIDRPGHGWSLRPGGAADATPAQQAVLIAQALDRLGIGRFVLLGHSLGGAVALAFALAFPDRLAGLVLLAPVSHPWPGGISWYNRLLSTPVVGPLFARTVALPLGALLMGSGAASVFIPQPAPEDYIDRAAIRLLLRPSQFVANAQDIAALKRSVTAQAPRYGEITTPTLILTGSADTVVSPRLHAQALARTLANARLIVLEDAGHMPHHTHTDAVMAAIAILEGPDHVSM
jgi:pimeloyl-ACP methyl ester carboxylesterase